MEIHEPWLLCHTPYIKPNLRWIIAFKGKARTVSLRQGSIGENLYNLKLYKDFLDKTPRELSVK